MPDAAVVEAAAATKIQAMQRKKVTQKQLTSKLFESVLDFDVNRDGFIARDEMKTYLKAIGEWESEPLYTDAEWPVSWPIFLDMLGVTDVEQGLPFDSFVRYHEKYRGSGKLVSDLHRVSATQAAIAEAETAAATKIQARHRGRASQKQLTSKLFESVQEFDVNKNGFIAHDEMKTYLKVVGKWESEPMYTDAEWPVSWPFICELLGVTDVEQGMPFDSFLKYHEKYRGSGKLVSDLHRVSAATKA